jgi:hypothetical protein
MIDLPDFGTPLRRIAGSAETLADISPERETGLRMGPDGWPLPPDRMTGTEPCSNSSCFLQTILPDSFDVTGR